MTRRELLLRMARGESLFGHDMKHVFRLGDGRMQRDEVRPGFVLRMIEDGLVETGEHNKLITCKLTNKADEWLSKRSICFNPLVTV